MICQKRIKLFFFLLAFGVIQQTHATSPEKNISQTLIERAKEKQLASSKQWLRLLHYNQGGTLHSKNLSYANSKTFFLSKEGHDNPEKELELNIKAFFFEDKEKRCQFPARYQWLSEQLAQDNYQQGLEHCALYQQVKNQVAAKKMVLVFPSAYMNSASSIFGHTLLRIDTDENDESVILNWAINYGAKLDSNDNSFEYAIKGIGGLYKGQYFVVPYAQKIKEYGQMENRDIWEYPLNLNEEEINFLLAHLWELKDIDFDYFFFDENCSYRLLELLEVARPELELTTDFRFTEIPINTVKILNQNQMIEGEIFRPSKESLLKAQLSQLNKKEIQLSETLADTKLSFELSSELKNYIEATAEKKLSILDTAYDLVRFRQSQQERDSALAKRSLDLLSSINSISLKNPDVEHSILEIDSESILNTHDSQRLQVSAGRIKDLGNFAELEYRMAYHDLLDNSYGFLNGAHIEGPAIALRHFDNQGRIDSWQLVDIISITPINKLRKDLSWNLSIQGQKSEQANKHMSSFLQAGGGFALQYKNWIHYQMLSPRIENNSQYEQDVQAGLVFSAGLLHNKGRHASLLALNIIKLEEESTLKKLEYSQQIELSRNHALRIQLLTLRQNENLAELKQDSARLSYLFYF